MNRKYLDDLGVPQDCRPDGWNEGDKRQAQWAKEREIYGFDERETWNLDYSFYLWLYERLKMYLEISPVDLNFHTFKIGKEKLTQKECIERMIEGCAIRIKDNRYFGELTEDEEKKIDDVLKIWAVVCPAMWW